MTRPRTWLALLLALPTLGAGALPAPARDRAGDGRFSERASMHFLLEQDAKAGPGEARPFERDVIAQLEAAYGALSSELGLRPGAKVRVRIYAADQFDQLFAERFAFRAAGFFDGAIHVRGGEQLDAALAGTLRHEYTHAAIAAALGPRLLPAWLNEGLAEHFADAALGQAGPTAGQRAYLAQVRAAGSWIPLAQLSGPSLVHMPGESAGLAYLEAHAAVDWLARRCNSGGLRRLWENVVRLGSAPGALESSCHLTPEELERRLLAELR